MIVARGFVPHGGIGCWDDGVAAGLQSNLRHLDPVGKSQEQRINLRPTDHADMGAIRAFQRIFNAVDNLCTFFVPSHIAGQHDVAAARQ